MSYIFSNKNNIIKFTLLIVLALIFFSCKNNIEDVKALTYRDTFPIQTSLNVEMIYSDSAKIVAKMISPLIKRYEGSNPYIEFPKGLNLVFYDSLGKQSSTLSSKYAIKYNNSNIWEARNDVVVTNNKGEKLNTEQLVWDEAKRKIYTTVFVKITQPEKILLGDGLDADESFDKWVIRKPRGNFNIHTEDKKNEEKVNP